MGQRCRYVRLSTQGIFCVRNNIRISYIVCVFVCSHTTHTTKIIERVPNEKLFMLSPSMSKGEEEAHILCAQQYDENFLAKMNYLHDF